MGSSKLPVTMRNLFSFTSRNRCMTNIKNMKAGKMLKPQDKVPEAAVLVPMCRVNDVPALLYTVRSPELRSHGGQICFPGGKINPSETPTQAALRETEEEIGLRASKVEVWGTACPVPGRKGNVLITPVIGTVLNLKREDLKMNPKEVTEIFAIPINTLSNPKSQFYTQFQNGMILPVFVADDYKIWGVTAYLTHMFLSSLLPPEVYKNDWISKKVKLVSSKAKKEIDLDKL